MFQVIEFFDQIHSDLKGLSFWIKQSYRYYISVFKENTNLIDIEFFKFQNNVFTTFKNYRALHKK